MEQHFYSSRKERLETASSETKRAYAKRNNKSFFKRNPHLRILVIDMIIVLLFATIIIPFFIKITKDIRFDDYKITSKAIQFEEDVLISIKVSKLYKKISNRITTENLKVDIINNNSIMKSKEVSFPIISGEDIFISFKLDHDIEQEIVNIQLSSGNYLKQYKVRIER